MITNAELVKEVQKAGRIEVPVLTSAGVEHLVVNKSDLLDYLKSLPQDEQAPWLFYNEHADGTRRLDVQD